MWSYFSSYIIVSFIEFKLFRTKQGIFLYFMEKSFYKIVTQSAVNQFRFAADFSYNNPVSSCVCPFCLIGEFQVHDRHSFILLCANLFSERSTTRDTYECFVSNSMPVAWGWQAKRIVESFLFCKSFFVIS